MLSSVGLGITANKLPPEIQSPSDSLLHKWAPVHCVIADELLMTDLSFFGLWEEALGHAKENTTEPFGGIITVLMFDHCQLRTVSGTAMFSKESTSPTPSAAEKHGRELYQSIRKVVYLTQNMRFASDPEWGQWLAAGRLRNWTHEIRTFIASLPDADLDNASTDGTFLQTISVGNVTRCAVNDNAVRVAIQSLGNERKVYAIPSRLSRQISQHEAAYIKQLPDNKTGHVPLFLHVHIGMPVRIKSNQCVSKGLANGASAVLHHIDWDSTSTFELQSNGAWLASQQPLNMYVDLVNSPSPARFPTIPDEWPSSIMPVHKVTATLDVNGPHCQ